MTDSSFFCAECGEDVDPRRWELGYRLCLDCGEQFARQVVRCVAPMAKSNYVLISNKEQLKGLNKNMPIGAEP